MNPQTKIEPEILSLWHYLLASECSKDSRNNEENQAACYVKYDDVNITGSVVTLADTNFIIEITNPADVQAVGTLLNAVRGEKVLSLANSYDFSMLLILNVIASLWCVCLHVMTMSTRTIEKVKQTCAEGDRLTTPA